LESTCRFGNNGKKKKKEKKKPSFSNFQLLFLMLCYFFIFMQVKIMICNSTLQRQQPGITDTRDRPAVLRGFNELVVFFFLFFVCFFTTNY